MIINESNNKLLLSLTENDLWRLSQGKERDFSDGKESYVLSKQTHKFSSRWKGVIGKIMREE